MFLLCDIIEILFFLGVKFMLVVVTSLDEDEVFWCLFVGEIVWCFPKTSLYLLHDLFLWAFTPVEYILLCSLVFIGVESVIGIFTCVVFPFKFGYKEKLLCIE